MYNAFYAAGMLMGPKVSSLLFAHYGGGAMLLHLAAMWMAFVIFTVVFRSDVQRVLCGGDADGSQSVESSLCALWGRRHASPPRGHVDGLRDLHRRVPI